jgi:hypothetical protein
MYAMAAFANPTILICNSPSYQEASGLRRCRVDRPPYRPAQTKQGVLVKMQSETNRPEAEEDGRPHFKFDVNSDKDAFGRDPRKETEYWMSAASELLRSEEVRKAQKKLAAEGKDGMTEEQRAYLEFAKGLSSTPKTSERGSTGSESN